MRHGILATLTIAVIAAGLGHGQAADLPIEPARTLLPPPAPVAQWTGFFAGVHGGYAWGRTDMDQVGPADPGSMRNDGWLLGGQIGYDHQFQNLVLGAEADISWSSVDGQKNIVGPGGTDTVKGSIDYLATLRGRIGVTNGPLLIYGTGGVAWAGTTATLTLETPPPGFGATQSTSETVRGWTAGAGLEWWFAPNWSTRLEYLHVDFEKAGYRMFGLTFPSEGKLNLVRGAVNLRF